MPHKVVVNVIDHNNKTYSQDGILIGATNVSTDCSGTSFLFRIDNQSCLVDITEFKPYLRPMSSMTEDEKKIYKTLLSERKLYGGLGIKIIDWLNTHHFDYRGLIEKGFALEAPKDMYKI